jgi:eukaryotic-like serine/threonine-protein kinase
MLYQLLAGILPFRGESMSELMFKIANEEAADIRLVRPELPESLANVVALSLSKRPETRYQTGEQFAADLRAVDGGFVQTASRLPDNQPQEIRNGMEQTIPFDATVPNVPMGAGPSTRSTDIEI